MISGVNGRQIRTIPAPNREEIFVPIQLITDMDGSEFLLVLTGGQNSPGGIYKIPLFAMARPLAQVFYSYLNITHAKILLLYFKSLFFSNKIFR